MSGYNGYTNYATWAANLWIQSEEGSYYYWTEAAKRAESADELAEQLKDAHIENMPADVQGVYSDLLTYTLESVNWREIAEVLREGIES